MKVILFFIAALVSLAWSKQFSYEGLKTTKCVELFQNLAKIFYNFRYKVWSVTPLTDDHGKLLKQWEDNESIDFWEEISRKGRSSDIMVAPKIQIEFEDFLKDNGIAYELIIDNVERYAKIRIV